MLQMVSYSTQHSTALSTANQAQTLNATHITIKECFHKKNYHIHENMPVDVAQIISNFVYRVRVEIRKDLGVTSNEELVKYVMGSRQAPKSFPALSYFFKAIWKRCCELGLTDPEKVVVLAGSSQGTDIAAAVADFLEGSKRLFVDPHERMESFLRLLRIVSSSPRRPVSSPVIRRETRSMRRITRAREM